MILYTCFIFLVLLSSLWLFRPFRIQENKVWMPFAFMVKVGVGFLFLYVYSVYYGSEQLTADAGKFMSESRILTRVFYESPKDFFAFLFNQETDEMVRKYLSSTTHWAGDPNAILNDSRNVLKFHALINLVSFGFAPINMIISCFMAVFGIYHLFQAFKNYVALNKKWLFAALVIAPSTLFWTSGLLKEPFLFLGIGLFCRGLVVADSSRKRVIYLLLGTFLLISFKVYTILFILLGWLVYLILMRFNRLIVGISVVIAVAIIGFIALFFGPTNKAVKLLSDKQFDFIGISKGGNYLRNDSTFFIFTDEQMKFLREENGGYFLTQQIEVESAFPYQKVEPKKVLALPNEKPWLLAFRFNRCGSYIPLNYINYSPKQLARNIPQAISNAGFRPHFLDPGSELKYFAALETLALVAFLLFSFIKRRKLSKKEQILIAGLITFIVGMLLLIGWTTPVLGAIVRYRFSAYLAIMIIGLILLKSNVKPHQA